MVLQVHLRPSVRYARLTFGRGISAALPVLPACRVSDAPNVAVVKISVGMEGGATRGYSQSLIQATRVLTDALLVPIDRVEKDTLYVRLVSSHVRQKREREHSDPAKQHTVGRKLPDDDFMAPRPNHLPRQDAPDTYSHDPDPE